MDTHTKINKKYHEKITQEAKKENITIKKMYEKIINFYFDSKQDQLNNTIQHLVETQFNKMDRHLASMLARNNMDTAITLVSIFFLIEKLTDGVMTQEEIHTTMRKLGAKYLNRVVQEDKKKNR